MTTLPSDIQDRINQLFPLMAERQEAERLLLSLWTRRLNVGSDQLARSILVLSDGDISVIQQIFNSNFTGDPRDVIVSAEYKKGNLGNYFADPFNDADKEK